MSHISVRPLSENESDLLESLLNLSISGINQGIAKTSSTTFANVTFGGSGGGTWGSITGTLSNQTDLQSALDAKQATLVSGTNIKTINSVSLLGAGDIVIDATVTLADLSANSLTTPNSLYTMTSTIPVEFRSSDGNTILYIDETNERIGIGTATPQTTVDISGGLLIIGAIGSFPGVGRADSPIEIQNTGTGHALYSAVLNQNPGNVTNEGGLTVAAYAGSGSFVQQAAFYTRWYDTNETNGYSVIGMHPNYFSAGIQADVAFEVYGAHGIGMFLGPSATSPTDRYLMIKRTSGRPSIVGTNDLVLDANYGGAADTVFLNAYNAGNVVAALGGGNVGIGTSAPDRTLEINSATGINLRLTYNDSNGSATNYVDFLVSSSGDLTITPSGGDIALGTSNLGMTGSLGATGARVTKGWFTDIESTNIPTVGGTAILTSLTAPQFTTIELGAASDTTLSRSAAGVLAVEGVVIPSISSTNTLTNKRITKRVVVASDATSITPNTDNADWTEQANTQSTGTLTINADSGTPTNKQAWGLEIKSTNVQTFSWNSQFVGGATALPTATTGGSKIDFYTFVYSNTNSKWIFSGSQTNVT